MEECSVLIETTKLAEDKTSRWFDLPIDYELFRDLLGVEADSKDYQIVKERIEGGANEKAVLRLFINCPFVCINFDFFWLNKARQLYMDF